MKRFSKLISTAFLILAASAYAQTGTTLEEIDSYELTNYITEITEARKPIVTDKYIIFTQETGPRYIGIAFNFEDYKTIHSFQVKNTRDVDGNITSSLMLFVLKRPADLTEITYRLIIDGLWTADPINPAKCYDRQTGISLSKVEIGNTLPVATHTSKERGTTFIYNGKPGQKVRLGGSFTNWDSWIYEMEEKEPGFYELCIPLPKGKYYYNYFLGLNAVTDKTNPEKAYTPEGRTSSVITVD